MIGVIQSTRVPPLPFSGALLALAVGLAWLISPPSKAQPPSDSPPGPASGAPDGDELSPAAEKVEVNPQSRDEDIGQRLQRVLEATEWFDQPAVRVEEGVVFLTGKTQTAELKKWAGDLARNTQDVVAVANRIEVREPSILDFSPAWNGLRSLWRDFVRSLPLIAFGLLVIGLSFAAGLLATQLARLFFGKRIRPRLLVEVAARAVGAVVFLFGIYVVLRVSGLTNLALSIVGGTGLVGLALGIAFRDITENFLASVFLSMQRPFQTGDLIEVAGVTGYVQQLNVRTTVLMTLEGTLVQIPNASVYKSNLRNFTTNANLRETFKFAIGYGDSINEVQSIVRQVLSDHPAVLNDPEPSILADRLNLSGVVLDVYFWLNGHEHSSLKVRSSIIRLTKMALQQRGISLHAPPTEVAFPREVPASIVLRRASTEANHKVGEPTMDRKDQQESQEISTQAEAGLYSEAGVIERQARQVQPLQANENLLQSDDSPDNPT